MTVAAASLDHNKTCAHHIASNMHTPKKTHPHISQPPVERSCVLEETYESKHTETQGEDFSNLMFSGKGNKGHFQVARAWAKQQRQTKGREGSQETKQEHLYHIQMSETPFLSFCTNLLPSSILFPNTTLHERVGPLEQVMVLSGRAICSNQLLLKSQEAHGEEAN